MAQGDKLSHRFKKLISLLRKNDLDGIKKRLACLYSQELGLLTPREILFRPSIYGAKLLAYLSVRKKGLHIDNISSKTAPNVIDLLGGLGNQMFIYAYALALEKKTTRPIYLLAHGLYTPCQLRAFNIGLPLISIHQKAYAPYINALPRLREHSLAYDEALFPSRASYIYSSYCQDERYFRDLREELLAAFSLKRGLNSSNKALLEAIKEPTTTAICLHMRLGDYTTSENMDIYGTLGAPYYKRAILKMLELLEVRGREALAPRFYVFSNDIGSAKGLIYEALGAKKKSKEEKLRASLKEMLTNGGGGGASPRIA